MWSVDKSAEVSALQQRLLAKTPTELTAAHVAKAQEAADPEGPWPYAEAEATLTGKSVSEILETYKTRASEGVLREAKRVAFRKSLLECTLVHQINLLYETYLGTLETN